MNWQADVLGDIEQKISSANTIVYAQAFQEPSIDRSRRIVTILRSAEAQIAEYREQIEAELTQGAR